jgi:hypothetical protein
MRLGTRIKGIRVPEHTSAQPKRVWAELAPGIQLLQAFVGTIRQTTTYCVFLLTTSRPGVTFFRQPVGCWTLPKLDKIRQRGARAQYQVVCVVTRP